MDELELDMTDTLRAGIYSLLFLVMESEARDITDDIAEMIEGIVKAERGDVYTKYI